VAADIIDGDGGSGRPRAGGCQYYCVVIINCGEREKATLLASV
jgi:hypothetical protein